MGLLDFFKNKDKNNNNNDNLDNQIFEENNDDDYEYEDFEMIVDDIFSIMGKGTVVTGEIN